MVRSLLALLVLLVSVVTAQAQSSFTYQGKLEDAGVAVNGAYDFRFVLYNAATAGTPVSGVVCAEDVSVVNGLFTVIVPLMAPANGLDCFLEIQVRGGSGGSCGDATGFVALAPRQLFTPTPRAVYAMAVAESSPPIPGALRFNWTTGQFEGFTGIFWAPFTMGAGEAPSNAQSFTTPGFHSFVVPAGVYQLGVDIWAGGGAGGARGPGSPATSCTSGTSCGGGGGGSSGSYARAALSVTPGETLTVYVGPGGMASSTDGGDGDNSSISRGIVIALRTAGGRGGDRGLTHSIGVSSSSCPSPPSGPGGTAPGLGQLFAPGTFLTNTQGNTGSAGRGPGCYTPGFPNPTTHCVGLGGSGAFGIASPSPLAALSAGAGGNGGYPDGPLAQNGQPGRVRVFWN